MKQPTSLKMQADRRLWIMGLTAGLGVGILAAWPRSGKAARGPLVEVWKSPSCGCCQVWIEHLESHGFSTRVHDVGNTAKRAQMGIALVHGSCHTAVVEGYAIEGHVPAREIQRLLKEKPRAIGLAVPGMPMGSPGMDGPEYGPRRDPYDVLLLQRAAAPTVYQSYR